MQYFRGGSEFHKYKSILAPDQSILDPLAFIVGPWPLNTISSICQ